MGGDLRVAATALTQRVLAHELSWERVELAAYLGDPAARRACEAASRTLPEPATEPGPLGRLLRWARRERALGPVERWAFVLERYGAAVHVRAAAAAVAPLLPVWEAAYPARHEARRAVEGAAVWSDCPCEVHRVACEKAAIGAWEIMRDGPGLCGHVPALAAAVAGMVEGAPGSVHPDLADVVGACVTVGAGEAVGRAARVAREAARQGGANDYDAWRRGREAAEGTATAALDDAREAVRAAVVASLVPWLLGAEPLDVQEEASSTVAARRRARPRRGGITPPVLVRASAAMSESHRSMLWGLARVFTGQLVPFGGLLVEAVRRDEELHPAAPRRAAGPEEPDAAWECPRCRALTKNTGVTCVGCGFRIA